MPCSSCCSVRQASALHAWHYNGIRKASARGRTVMKPIDLNQDLTPHPFSADNPLVCWPLIGYWLIAWLLTWSSGQSHCCDAEVISRSSRFHPPIRGPPFWGHMDTVDVIVSWLSYAYWSKDDLWGSWLLNLSSKPCRMRFCSLQCAGTLSSVT